MYEFYMSKPKEILIISDEDKKDSLKKLQKCGIKWLNKCEESKVAKYIEQGYQRLVWLKKDVESLQSLPTLPTRTFVTKQENNNYMSVGAEEIMEKIKDIADSENNETEKELYNLLTYLEKQWCKRLKPELKNDINNIILFRDSYHTDCLGKDWSNKEDEEESWNNNNKFFRALYHRHEINDSELVKKIKENKLFFVEVNGAQSRLESIWDWSSRKNTKAEIKNFYKYELSSAALTKIVILDERIQEEVDLFRREFCEDKKIVKASEFHQSFLKNLKSIDTEGVIAANLNRVHVPSKKDVDLYKPEWDEIKEYVKETNSDDPVDCIVIHWGVLQNIKYNGHKEENFINELNNWSRSVRVCTGRGRSMNNFGDKIIPFSELRRWVSSPNPSKYHLCKLLNL